MPTLRFSRLSRRLAALAAVTLLAGLLAGLVPATAGAATTGRQPTPKQPVATGYGGAVSTVDADATQAGLAVLRRGGNAVDAAVAAAAALGVTEPYSAGIGGGGFFTYYNARSKRVYTIDGRETAPASFTSTTFTENGAPIPFAEAVTSGLSNGIPGTPATWALALRSWGTLSLGQALRPAETIARNGFVVDPTFRTQTSDNADRFRDFPATAALYLPGGQPPAVGSVLRNPDLARTYEQLGRQGVGAIYGGSIGRDIVRTTQQPPVDPKATRKVRPGQMTMSDLRRYVAIPRTPTHVTYRGLDVFGMAPASSGGIAVGEALNILGNVDLSKMTQAEYLHYFLEASRYSFADRNRWVGDSAYVNVPQRELLSKGFARERFCQISPTKASVGTVAPGSPDGSYGSCSPGRVAAPTGYEGPNTTNLTTADRWGNVVEYTLTIEQTGGSGITVPGRGFLLNNELTDFNFVPITPGVPDPNLPGPGKRPRSSISPTIVLKDGKPFFATGSPGGATIITTALQVILGRVDRRLSLEDAIAAPRASQRNAAQTEAEPAFKAAPYFATLVAMGHQFKDNPEIGAATGIEFLRDGRLLAAAEPVRRGGGAAGVVRAG
ncbi:gamma-glutamyltransferase [Fodinicola acaciae]|uniref:gamma-glutamyltransferase n=1 Tax=Fodinicola acaciae TaxID=2681555 RepID=UPI0013D787C0|nr:gamma-glutamyltransferase [Fodinicola acaciae]